MLHRHSANALMLLAEEDGELLGSYYLKANAAGPGAHVGNCGYMVCEQARGRARHPAAEPQAPAVANSFD